MFSVKVLVFSEPVTIIIYTRKWFPLQGELAPLTKMLHFNKPIQIRSMLADILFQDTFAGEAGEGEGGEEETTGGYFYCYFYWYFFCSGKKVFCFLALEFHSQNTPARMGIINRRMSCAHGY